MGDVYWGLHIPLANQLIKQFDIVNAIETGTYYGSGSIHLAALCKRVYTIEHDPLLYEFVTNYYNHIKNIEFLNGSSPSVLMRILPKITDPILFVLDAHWFNSSPRSCFEEGKQCPLWEELQMIEDYCVVRSKSAIIIDDADMFLGALPSPFRSDDFPSIARVLNRVQQVFPNSTVDVLDDIIIAGPPGIERLITEYRAWKIRVGTPRK